MDSATRWAFLSASRCRGGGRVRAHAGDGARAGEEQTWMPDESLFPEGFLSTSKGAKGPSRGSQQRKGRKVREGEHRADRPLSLPLLLRHPRPTGCNSLLQVQQQQAYELLGTRSLRSVLTDLLPWQGEGEEDEVEGQLVLSLPLPERPWPQFRPLTVLRPMWTSQHSMRPSRRPSRC